MTRKTVHLDAVDPAEYQAALLSELLRLASLGLSVIPMHFVPKKGKPDEWEKVPTVGWKKFQETPADETEIRRWRRLLARDRTGIGIVTGTVSGGLWVLDTDSPEAEEFVAGFNLVETPTVRTARGLHRYFMLPSGVEVEGKQGKIHPKIDTRSKGNFVVCPPTLHPDGVTYTWTVGIEAGFADAPEELLAIEGSGDGDDGDKAVIARHPYAVVIAAMQAHGSERRSKGSDNWSWPEPGSTGHTISIREIEGVVWVKNFGTGSSQDVLDALGLGKPPTVTVAKPAAARRKKTEIRFIGPGEDESMEEFDEIVEQMIYTGQRILIASLPKSGKSVFMLAMAGAIINRRAFLGHETEPTRVLYLTEEGPTTFAAKLRQFGIEDASRFRYLRHRSPGVGEAKWEEIVDLTHRTAIEFGAGLVVVDVLHRWASFDAEGENRSGVVREALEALDPLAESGIAVVVLHHAPWAAKRGRGSTDMHGAVDHVFYIDGVGSDARTLENMSGRLPIEWDRISFRIGEDGLLEPLGPQRKAGASRTVRVIEALERLGKPSTTGAVTAELELEDSQERTVRRWLDRAQDFELIAHDVGPRAEFLWRKRRRFEYWSEL